MELGITQTDQQDPRSRKRWFTEPTLVTRIGRPVAARALPLLANISLAGVEHLPPTGPFVLAANHVSALDSVILDALLPRYPYFMAKSELFKHPLAAWFLRYAGAFPVERKGGDEWAIHHALHVLESGQVLGIYPEGTRSRKKGSLGKAKTGAVRIALQKNVPIVPVAISGTDMLLKQSWNLLRPPPVSVRIGEPFDIVSRITEFPPSQETIRNLTEELMLRIAKMLPQDRWGRYAQVI
ncbi:MAG: 1-acyl-sn-glycerol-3-phosphate acyltransferase [Anaerolineae bacterium]|nr:1-acyl-sn-glycerol-3-phosphate acyltransferase [Anaerolineae bacterium]